MLHFDWKKMHDFIWKFRLKAPPSLTMGTLAVSKTNVNKNFYMKLLKYLLFALTILSCFTINAQTTDNVEIENLFNDDQNSRTTKEIDWKAL
jgi:hypothetical protein